MKILVTGGLGFIGSHTSLNLLEKGYSLLIIDSLINSSPVVFEKLENFRSFNKISSNMEFFKGDIRDEIFLNNLFRNQRNKNENIVAVIHFAGLKAVGGSIKNPLRYWDFNLKGTINLLNVMEKYGCRNLVFSSSATVYGKRNDKFLIKEDAEIKPINPYGNTKATIEIILDDLSKIEKNRWNIISLRYFNPIGAHSSRLLGENPVDNPNNLMPIINNVAAGNFKELKIFGSDWETKDGTCVRDYIHVMDLANGHTLALNNILNSEPKNIQINLGTGKGTSVLQLVKTFQKVNNVKVPYKFSNRRKGDVAISVADNKLAKSFLKWLPQRNVEMMCIDSWEWFKKINKL
jgi:UDP-glucose 4-epimerase